MKNKPLHLFYGYLASLTVAVCFSLMLNTAYCAEEIPKQVKRLEDMSAAEFKEILKKSHAESAARLGGNLSLSESGLATGKTSSLSEKRAYETSAQSRIDMLSHKIRSLENHYYDNWGYAQKDAAKLREIQMKARDHLMKIRMDDTESWRTHKSALESLLRQTTDY